MLPRATKTQMIKFLKDRGYDIVKSRTAEFGKYRDSFWLDYEDSTGCWHQAYYSAAGGRPIFSVDRNFIDITLDDVIKHGMYRSKGRKECTHDRC